MSINSEEVQCQRCYDTRDRRRDTFNHIGQSRPFGIMGGLSATVCVPIAQILQTLFFRQATARAASVALCASMRAKTGSSAPAGAATRLSTNGDCLEPPTEALLAALLIGTYLGPSPSPLSG